MRSRVRRRPALITGGVLVAALVIVIVLLTGGDGPAKRPAGPVEACNG